jgi:hypothetical protein
MVKTVCLVHVGTCSSVGNVQAYGIGDEGTSRDECCRAELTIRPEVLVEGVEAGSTCGGHDSESTRADLDLMK